MTNTGPIVQQGAGVYVSIGDSLTLIPYRKKITPAKSKRSGVDTTDLDSTADTSIPDPVIANGVMSFQINFNPKNSVHAYCRASFQSGTQSETFEHVLSNGSSYPFTGWFSGFDVDDEQPHSKDPQTATVEVTVSGPITDTP